MAPQQERELKLACLHHAEGNLDKAKQLFAWVAQSDSEPGPARSAAKPVKFKRGDGSSAEDWF